jgi:hypothetical protein
MEWNEKSDIWGIACIMMELYTGNIYFSTHESYEHLSMIEKNSGILKICIIIPKRKCTSLDGN